MKNDHNFLKQFIHRQQNQMFMVPVCDVRICTQVVPVLTKIMFSSVFKILFRMRNKRYKSVKLEY